MRHSSTNTANHDGITGKEGVSRGIDELQIVTLHNVPYGLIVSADAALVACTRNWKMLEVDYGLNVAEER